MMRGALVVGFLCAWQAPAGLPFPLALPGGPEGQHGLPMVPLLIDLDPRAATVTLEVAVLTRDAPGAGGWRVEGRGPVRPGEPLRLHGVPDRETLLVLLADPAAGYSLDGPFRWPRQPERRGLGFVPRRTIRGEAPFDLSEGETVQWMSADGMTEPDWPVCLRPTSRLWECFGVPAAASGVVVAGRNGDGRLAFAVAPPGTAAVQTMRMRTAVWGRLIELGDAWSDPVAGKVRVVAVRPEMPRVRRNARTVRLAADAAFEALPVSRGAVWLAGRELADGALLQVTGPPFATVRTPMDGWHLGPADVPIRIGLRPGLSLHGLVVDPAGEPVSGAAVTLFEVRADDEAGTGRRPAWRWHLADAVSGPDGRFTLGGLAEGAYELLAVHQHLGRARQRLVPDATAVTIRLDTPRQVRGRVLSGGEPAAGIPVLVVPDLLEYADSADATDYLSPATSTDAGGRFRAGLPRTGSAELRIGSPDRGIRRLPLQAPPGSTLIDVGDIDLSDRIIVDVVVGELDRCVFSAAGPAGSAGLSLVRADRPEAGLRRFAFPEPGGWVLSAACGSEVVPLVPPVLTVQPAAIQPRVLVQRR